jgi:cytoskeletal protein RodZ
MNRSSSTNSQAGMALFGLLAVLLVVVAVVGAGVYVMQQRTLTTTTAATTKQQSSTASSSPSGAIDQLIQSEANSEATTSTSSDAQGQQDALSANGSVSNVGGAYNESNL